MGLHCVLRQRVRSRVQAAAVLVLLSCSGLSLEATASELVPVRIGLTLEASAAPLLIAVQAGFFQAEGLDAQLMFLKDDASVSAAVVSGKADIGMASLSAAFYAGAAAHGLKVIASRSSDQTGFPMYALLVSKKAQAAGLTGVRGLPNSRIGVAGEDSGAYYALLSIASRFKLDPGSIKTIPLKSPARELAALPQGDIDAALLPFPTALRSVKGGQSLLRLSDFLQWQEGVVFTTAEDIAQKRTLVERFMRAYQRGTAEYQINFLNYDDGGDFIPGPHYQAYLDALARRLHIPADTLARTKTYCDRRANLDVADIGRQVLFWQGQGRLAKDVQASDLLDVSFIGEEILTPH